MRRSYRLGDDTGGVDVGVDVDVDVSADFPRMKGDTAGTKRGGSVTVTSLWPSYSSRNQYNYKFDSIHVVYILLPFWRTDRQGQPRSIPTSILFPSRATA